MDIEAEMRAEVKKTTLDECAWIAGRVIDYCRERGETDLRSIKRLLVTALREGEFHLDGE